LKKVEVIMSDHPFPIIVLVEDSNTQALQIAANLTARDIEVMVATDGPQGLRLIASTIPDAVVLDIYLPTMDGFQVCRRLKRDPETEGIPIIMLTSADAEEDKVRGLANGATAYITKDEQAVNSLLQALRNLNILEGEA
jgi:DNA-binding response OmpR family regulator